jgi:hypothetical protein
MWLIRHIKYRILVVSDWYIYILMCCERLRLLSSAALCRSAVYLSSNTCMRRRWHEWLSRASCIMHTRTRSYLQTRSRQSMCVLFNCYWLVFTWMGSTKWLHEASNGPSGSNIVRHVRWSCFIVLEWDVPCNKQEWNYERLSRVSTVGSGNVLQAGRSRVRFPMVSLEVLINIILRSRYWPWGRLSFYQK